MNKNWEHRGRQLGLAIALLAASNFSFAQPNVYSSLNDRIIHAKQVLVELDEKALTCISSFSLNLGEAAALLCDEFMRAIDGEILASYIEDCSVLKSWRDEFAGQSLEPGRLALRTGEAPQLAAEITTVCGEGALQNLTTYVVSAFNTLASGTLLNQSIKQSFDVRLSELQQQTRIDRERRALQNAIDAQREQRERATQAQQHNIEMELLRQQIKNQ